jgi:predicted outer membrane repeat protein
MVLSISEVNYKGEILACLPTSNEITVTIGKTSSPTDDIIPAVDGTDYSAPSKAMAACTDTSVKYTFVLYKDYVYANQDLWNTITGDNAVLDVQTSCKGWYKMQPFAIFVNENMNITLESEPGKVHYISGGTIYDNGSANGTIYPIYNTGHDASTLNYYPIKAVGGHNVSVFSGGTLNLRNVIIENGYSNVGVDGMSCSYGGIATQSGSNVVLGSGVSITNCADASGAISGYGNITLLSGSKIYNNAGCPGGFKNRYGKYSTLTIMNGTVTLKGDVKIYNNYGEASSGLCMSSATLNLLANDEGAPFIYNNCSGSGSAIRSTSSTLNISAGKLSYNYATGNGGAIYLENSSLNITGDAVFKNNYAGGDGGAIYSNDSISLNFNLPSDATMTFVNNKAGNLCDPNGFKPLDTFAGKVKSTTVDSFPLNDSGEDGDEKLRYIAFNNYDISSPAGSIPVNELNLYPNNNQGVRRGLDTESTLHGIPTGEIIDANKVPELNSGKEGMQTLWYDNKSLSGDPISFPYTMPAGNVSLYAKYIIAPKKNVTICTTYKENDVEPTHNGYIYIGSMAPTSANKDNPIIDGEAQIKDVSESSSYNIYWSETGNVGTFYDTGIEVPAGSAKDIDIPLMGVYYNSSHKEIGSIPFAEYVIPGTNHRLAPNDLKRTGYNPDGWVIGAVDLTDHHTSLKSHINMPTHSSEYDGVNAHEVNLSAHWKSKSSVGGNAKDSFGKSDNKGKNHIIKEVKKTTTVVTEVKKDNKSSKSALTGDGNNIILMFILFGISAILIRSAVKYRKK